MDSSKQIHCSAQTVKLCVHVGDSQQQSKEQNANHGGASLADSRYREPEDRQPNRVVILVGCLQLYAVLLRRKED